MQEKRKFVRIHWPVVVHYKTIEEPHTQDQIVGKDISAGGVSFIVYEKLVKNTELELQIQVPFDSMPIFAMAKVAWIKSVGEENSKNFEVGVKFIKIEPKDKKRFTLYIENEIKSRKDQ